MSAIAEELAGIVLVDDARTALALLDDGQPVCLRYGLQTFAEDLVILPELALDDWGREIHGLPLYQWLQENGLQFPRAEIFGYDPAGARQQYFLRDIDLMAKYPCYAYASRNSPLNEGRLVEAILIPSSSATQLRPRRQPPGIDGPLREVRVDWWDISLAEFDNFSFTLLDQTDKEGREANLT